MCAIFLVITILEEEKRKGLLDPSYKENKKKKRT